MYVSTGRPATVRQHRCEPDHNRDIWKEPAIMAICEHTPPPRPPRGGSIGDFTWIPEVDNRRGLIGLHMTHGQYRDAQLQASLWLSPDDAEKVGSALLAAVAAWRGAQ